MNTQHNYILINNINHQILVSNDVRFIEDEFEPLRNIQVKMSTNPHQQPQIPHIGPRSNYIDTTDNNVIPEGLVPPHNTDPQLQQAILTRNQASIAELYDQWRRGKISMAIYVQRVKALPAVVVSESISNTESQSYDDAINSRDAAKWIQSMDSEMDSLYIHITGTLVPRPQYSNVLPNKWVHKIKYDSSNQPVKYKSCLVVKGYALIHGYDFFDTWAPTIRITAIYIVLAIVATLDLELHQLDVDTAFLYGDVDADVYMEQPEGYVDNTHPDYVWRLNKSLYGLKQSPKIWYSQVNDYFINELHFSRVPTEYGLYVLSKPDIYCIICLYVDDMLIACNDKQYLVYIKHKIGMKWKIKDLRQAQRVLGMNIRRHRRHKLLCVNQSTYIQSILILERFNMSNAQPVDTPASLDILARLSSDTDTSMHSNIPYRQTTGSLIYLSYTRPDIVFAVQQVCKHNNKYNNKHWTAVKRIMRYIKGTINYELIFNGDTKLTLTGYSRPYTTTVSTTRQSATSAH